MTDEQINQRIAEACGWTDIGECTCGFKLRGYPPEYSAHGKHIPNYCNDLNAMHLTEKILSDAQWEDYIDYLANDWGRLPDPWREVCHSTARQRAEAFLRTLGKWEEVLE